MDSQLNFVDVLLTDLELQTEIEESNKGAEMFVIAIFGKATFKDGGGNKQRPHRPRQRHERWTICCWVGNGCSKRWRYHLIVTWNPVTRQVHLYESRLSIDRHFWTPQYLAIFNHSQYFGCPVLCLHMECSDAINRVLFQAFPRDSSSPSHMCPTLGNLRWCNFIISHVKLIISDNEHNYFHLSPT